MSKGHLYKTTKFAGETMERISKLKQLLENSPGDCFLLHALGLEYIKLGDVDTAISYFEQVLKNDPAYVGTYYHLGAAYEKKGLAEKAQQQYEKGIEIALAARDLHAKNELQMALDELLDL